MPTFSIAIWQPAGARGLVSGNTTSWEVNKSKNEANDLDPAMCSFTPGKTKMEIPSKIKKQESILIKLPFFAIIPGPPQSSC